MEASYLKSQHPVVEELLTNKYFGDTLLVCANGHLTDNKLAVGLLFPCLLSSDIFALPIENVLLVPDYTMEEIGREFEKLIIGGNSKQPKEQTERVERDNSPAELVIDDTIDTIENGFDENCDNIEIGESNGETIQIFVNNEGAAVNNGPDAVTVVETDDIPPDIQVELFTNTTSEASEETSETQEVTDKNSIVDPLENNTDGDLYIMEKRARSVSVNVKNLKPKVWKQTKLKLKLEDDCQNVIENLPNLPDPEPEKTKEPSPKKSPKKESPILENRKPGRPRTKGDVQTPIRKLENGLTKFKAKSAEWVAKEMFKCPICTKVLSCRGSYERHSRMHQNSKPFKCSFCPKTFREACKKNVHERIHSGSKPYPCSKCSKSFRTATQRIVHQRSHTKEKPFNCSVCGKVFSQPYSVKVHMEKFHK